MKMDKFVFWCNIAGIGIPYLFIFLAFLTKEPIFITGKLFTVEYMKIPTMISSAMILIYFLRDNDYKLLYFLLNFMCVRFTMLILNDILNIVIQASPMITQVIRFFIFIITMPLFSAYVYQFFKEKSYKKYKSL
ncbi:hypothetical protein IX317_000348 [Fusobacterium sp. DD29]|uniref:hypothetical protein n=1 Tax=unclassified Fusobacterium TaxID=2648384 RepID=UPI001B8BD04F|nr:MULTISPECIES: hypothetical protein [unclassified Fusobacterium]MBR8748689.1 hypothetical protein [Fusobacterium sp. DD29]MBR8760959.1 hypothetical protein [Fusobacterium sp. DD25]MBR8766968.1 hypothetical protein [Fusobacterium sp. DD43]MBR8770969.1 hypothetical protein [Fusobacterium sp. DD40]MBR8775244.1 hypothetical protein [Fusobacterium sp. DD17]